MVEMFAKEANAIEEARAGDIIALVSMQETETGDTLCDSANPVILERMRFPDPVISVSVKPKLKGEQEKFGAALGKMVRADPSLHLETDRETGQTILRGMGELHLEVTLDRMRTEFNVEGIMGEPQVAYRETITQRAEIAYTHKKQTGGSGQFARVNGYMEPLPPDAVETYEFVDEIVGGSIPREFIPACDKGFKEGVKRGALIGFPVVGIRCVINDGLHHAVDSSEQAFKTAALMGFREAYSGAKPTILEPIMKVEIEAPSEFQGSVVGQVNQRRGVILETVSDENVTVTAEVPLNTMFGYSTDLRSATQGKGNFTMEFARYSPVPKQEQDEMIKAYREKLAKEQAARK
jgi:elongation factor G